MVAVDISLLAVSNNEVFQQFPLEDIYLYHDFIYYLLFLTVSFNSVQERKKERKQIKWGTYGNCENDRDISFFTKKQMNMKCFTHSALRSVCYTSKNKCTHP